MGTRKSGPQPTTYGRAFGSSSEAREALVGAAQSSPPWPSLLPSESGKDHVGVTLYGPCSLRLQSLGPECLVEGGGLPALKHICSAKKMGDQSRCLKEVFREEY